MAREGQFLDLPRWTPQVVEELFRRLVLKRLVAAERLSEDFQETLLGWAALGVRGARPNWQRRAIGPRPSGARYVEA